jgi:UDP:flavonoid glycosyltransferase YjiC (YdhE family)
MPYTICIDSLRIPRQYSDRVRMVGFLLEKKPEEVEGAERLREALGADQTETLIYAALSGPRQEREPLIQMLEPIFRGFPEGYRVVMSMGDPEGGSEPTTSGSLTKVPWVEDRYQYLEASDIVVCRGGHNTIMQSICYRKPSIIIPTPNHTEQYANSRRASELGLAVALHQEEVNRERLLTLINELSVDEGCHERLAEVASKGLTDGVENTVEAISGLMQG